MMTDRRTETLRRLAAALRSGDYVQGRGPLRFMRHKSRPGEPDQELFSVLGVLCDVVGAEWEKGRGADPGDWGIWDCDGETWFFTTDVPPHLAEASGLGPHLVSALGTLGDSSFWSFPNVAGLLDELAG